MVSIASLFCSTPLLSAEGDDANQFECPYFSLKTNLISDCVLAPNGELELPLGKRVSVAAELTAPWWLAKSGEYCYELVACGLEGRRWLGERATRPAMTGWFACAYCNSGRYDLQNRHMGAQGTFWNAGAGAGYAWHFSRSLGLELSLGIGYIRSHYEEYEPRENYSVLAYRRTMETSWWGPTRAKVSFVYRIGRRR